jgi:hypothetical protein
MSASLLARRERDLAKLVALRERVEADLARLEAEAVEAAHAVEAALAEAEAAHRLGEIDGRERDRRVAANEEERARRTRSMEAARSALAGLGPRVEKAEAELQQERLDAALSDLEAVERERGRVGARARDSEIEFLDRLESCVTLRARRDVLAARVRELGGDPAGRFVDEPDWPDRARLTELVGLGPDRPVARAAARGRAAAERQEREDHAHVAWAAKGTIGRLDAIPQRLRAQAEAERSRRRMEAVRGG